MADPNVVNIKGLPRIEEIVNGNLLIVENEQGANTLDFVNFVIFVIIFFVKYSTCKSSLFIFFK